MREYGATASSHFIFKFQLFNYQFFISEGDEPLGAGDVGDWMMLREILKHKGWKIANLIYK